MLYWSQPWSCCCSFPRRQVVETSKGSLEQQWETIRGICSWSFLPLSRDLHNLPRTTAIKSWSCFHPWPWPGLKRFREAEIHLWDFLPYEIGTKPRRNVANMHMSHIPPSRLLLTRQEILRKRHWHVVKYFLSLDEESHLLSNLPRGGIETHYASTTNYILWQVHSAWWKYYPLSRATTLKQPEKRTKQKRRKKGRKLVLILRVR